MRGPGGRRRRARPLRRAPRAYRRPRRRHAFPRLTLPPSVLPSLLPSRSRLQPAQAHHAGRAERAETAAQAGARRGQACAQLVLRRRRASVDQPSLLVGGIVLGIGVVPSLAPLVVAAPRRPQEVAAALRSKAPRGPAPSFSPTLLATRCLALSIEASRLLQLHRGSLELLAFASSSGRRTQPPPSPSRPPRQAETLASPSGEVRTACRRRRCAEPRAAVPVDAARRDGAFTDIPISRRSSEPLLSPKSPFPPSPLPSPGYTTLRRAVLASAFASSRHRNG